RFDDLSQSILRALRYFFCYCYGEHRDLHSFPTRRSSDLIKLERIGDDMENIMELVDSQISSKVKFSESALKDLDDMFDLTVSTLRQAIKALETDDLEQAKMVLQKEIQIDQMERDLRHKHI